MFQSGSEGENSCSLWFFLENNSWKLCSRYAKCNDHYRPFSQCNTLYYNYVMQKKNPLHITFHITGALQLQFQLPQVCSPEPSLVAHRIYGPIGRFREKTLSLALLNGCQACTQAYEKAGANLRNLTKRGKRLILRPKLGMLINSVSGEKLHDFEIICPPPTPPTAYGPALMSEGSQITGCKDPIS